MGEGRRKKKREGKISKVERLELAVLEKNRCFLTWLSVCFVCLNACSNSLSSIYFIYLPPPHCSALYLHCQNHSLSNKRLFYWEIQLLLSRNHHLFMSMCTRDHTHLSRTASIKSRTWWHDHERVAPATVSGITQATLLYPWIQFSISLIGVQGSRLR